MKEVSPTDWTDFSLSEEARDGNLSHPFLDDGAVMMGAPEEPFAAAAATEEQRPQRRIPMIGPVGGEEHVQVVAGGFGIAKLKLNRLTFLNDVADRNRPGSLVCADKVTHQKITAFKAAPMLVDRDADVQSTMGVSAERSFQ